MSVLKAIGMNELGQFTIADSTDTVDPTLTGVGVLTNELIKRPVAYNAAGTIINNPRFMLAQATITTGTATAYLTDNGTSTGNAIFATVLFCSPSLSIDGKSYQFGAWAYNAATKMLSVTVTQSSTISVVGINVLSGPVNATTGTIWFDVRGY